MALKGNLRDFSTAQLLNLINLERKTGTLARVLQKAGKIPEDVARAIETQADVKSDKELGLLLINAGYVSQDDIIQSVRNYVLNNVYPIFTWPEGDFRFEANVLPFEDRITVPIDLENVIMEGSRRLKEWEHLQEELPDLDMALKFADRPQVNLRNINLSVEEWRVISFINPRNTIRQIAQYNNMSEFQIRKIVYGLLQAGLVELVQPEGAPAPTPAGKPKPTPVTMRRPAVKRNVILRLIDRIRKL